MARRAPEWIELVVSDDGVGLAESFHTTEPRSLGLQLIRTLVRQLEGELSIASAAGRGASFEVRLPARYAQATHCGASPTLRYFHRCRSACGRGSVLRVAPDILCAR
jgi:signal transduction histidine kinase